MRVRSKPFGAGQAGQAGGHIQCWLPLAVPLPFPTTIALYTPPLSMSSLWLLLLLLSPCVHITNSKIFVQLHAYYESGARPVPEPDTHVRGLCVCTCATEYMCVCALCCAVLLPLLCAHRANKPTKRTERTNERNTDTHMQKIHKYRYILSACVCVVLCCLLLLSLAG